MTRVVLFALLAVVAAAAAVLSFSALRDLGLACGFDPHLAWLLPLVVDAGAAAGSVTWLSQPPGAARWFGRRLAVVLLLASVAGNAVGHVLEAYHVVASWPLVVAVSALAPAVLASVVHLVVLAVQDDTARPEVFGDVTEKGVTAALQSLEGKRAGCHEDRTGGLKGYLPTGTPGADEQFPGIPEDRTGVTRMEAEPVRTPREEGVELIPDHPPGADLSPIGDSPSVTPIGATTQVSQIVAADNLGQTPDVAAPIGASDPDQAQPGAGALDSTARPDGGADPARPEGTPDPGSPDGSRRREASAIETGPQTDKTGPVTGDRLRSWTDEEILAALARTVASTGVVPVRTTVMTDFGIGAGRADRLRAAVAVPARIRSTR